jgi:hypothetical protein
VITAGNKIDDNIKLVFGGNEVTLGFYLKYAYRC